MRNYQRNENLSTYYTIKKFQPCWSCKKACGGCSWSKYGEPIKGWTARKNVIPTNGKYAETYKIIDCPEYVSDRKEV